MSEIDIAGLRELLAKATPGEWQLRDGRDEFVTIGNCGGEGFGKPTPGYPGGNYRDTDWGNCYDDERLVVAAVNALPALLTAAERARALEAGARALEARWRRLASEHGVRQFTGNDHALFANELATMLPAGEAKET